MLGLVPRVIQTILLTTFILPIFCDVKMWRAMLHEIWQPPVPEKTPKQFEVVKGGKARPEDPRRMSSGSR